MDRSVDRQTYLQWDRDHLWHPFTPHSVYLEEDPLVIVAGEGNYLIDLNGRRYLDGVASLWCNVLGHRVAAIDDAISQQLGRIAHSTLLGHTAVPAITLAKRLADLAPPGLTRVFFSDNGSTAVEVALKMACQYWQQVEGGQHRARQGLLALENAYHGDTIGAVSVGGIDLFHQRFAPMVFPVIRAPVPNPARPPLGSTADSHYRDCVQRLEAIFEQHGPRLAAAIVEPRLQGAGGMIVYPADYLRRLTELCRAHGVLLIFDEVAVGMGRSGAMFACQKEGLEPDFLCIAKGLTGGYLPLSATLTRERIYEAFLGPPALGRTFFHGHTYTGNALGAAAALATLEVFEKERVLEGLPPKIACLGAELAKLRSLPGVFDVRQYGLAAGVELVSDTRTGESFPPAERRGMKVCLRAREKGVFLRPLGDVIVLMPPLSITLTEIQTLVESVAFGIQMELGRTEGDRP